MADHPSQLSLQLSHTLDRYGFSRSFIDYRRKFCDYSLFYWNDFEDDDIYVFVTGSKRDALCSYHDTYSDIDLLGIQPSFRVFSETNLHKPVYHKVFDSKLDYEECILEKGQKAGYYFLQYKGYTCNTEFENLSSFRECIYFDNTLKGIVLEKANKDQVPADVQGPAVTVSASEQSRQRSVDGVVAVRCPFLPEDCEEWIHRRRDNGWPPQWVIETAKKTGCLLVGVGHPASDTQIIEWRLSLNKTEHLLTKSFNNIQMKCYVLLRMVLKWIIQPNIKDPLTSYHAKTVMFWMAEEREKQFWRPENIAECLMSSISKLRKYVSNRNCPNYFLTDVNLLEGKLEGDIHNRVLGILDSIIVEGPTVVFRCLPLNVHMNGTRCHHPIEDSCICLNKHLLGEILQEIVDGEHFINDHLLKTVNININVYRSCQFGFLGWHVVNEFHNNSILDSHIFSTISACEEMGLPNKRLYSLQNEYITKLRGNGFVARIKLATLFYHRRRLCCCLLLLPRVIKSMESSWEFEVCTHRQSCVRHEEIDGVECIYLSQNNKGFRVSEIVFSPCDKSLIPFDLQDEMGRPKTVNGTYYEGWVFVDSIVYVYYLLILTLHDLRRYRSIISLFRRFHKVCTQQPGAIRIFRKDMAHRLYNHAFMLVWASTKGFTRLS